MFNFKQIVLIISIFFCFKSSFSQVGINTIAPQSTLDINGNLSVKTITLVGSNLTTFIDDGVYISVNPQATDQEFKLPSPILFPGRIYFLRNINNTNTAKLTTTAGNFFFKGLTSGGVSTIYMYDNHYRTILIISDGSNWTVYDN
ncbi:hypothetical protein OX283_001805 [Flavobacterium sp. SUN052]|uniref:hypothetical protein n=1 Tax=Flavobacterium sp. SUN052 TaxID=3002441 RepID=UPI00237D4084|nr:hypothetical protein [Flavobacterium sp. SUN052]MEC4003377.1 hypothetical protein [Flavobacterium sp. SUN052]